MVIKQGYLIQNSDWDYLIILDACRYDFFKVKIGEYFRGQLIEARSAASCTLDWCKKTFNLTTYQNTVYVSGNPFINSKKGFKGFHASKVFKKVVDVWLDGWDDTLGTVHPSRVNRAVKNTVRKGSEKMIIHYLQPHEPYLINKYRLSGFTKPSPEMDRFLNVIHDKSIKPNRASRFSPNVRVKMKTLYLYYLQLLGKPPYSPMDDIRRRYGVEGIKEAYSLNLSAVLEEASVMYSWIIEHDPDARVVISSDHGEALGEGREYGHVCGRDSTLLLTIPWFNIEKLRYGSLANNNRETLSRVPI